MATQPSAAFPPHPLAPLATSLSSHIKLPQNRAGVNPKGRKFLLAFAGTLWLDPVKAAEEAGYKKPVEDGRRLMAKFAKIIERDKMELFRLQEMSAAEAKMLLSAIGRGTLPATPQQVKSLELVLRVHGMLTDKVDVNLEQSDLEKAMARAIEGFAGRQQSPQTLSSAPPLRLPEPVDR